METIIFNPEKKEKLFFLKTSFTGTGSFYFLIIVFFSGGLILLFSLPKEEIWSAAFLTGIALVLFLILLSQNANHRSYYSINNDELILKRGHTRRSIKLPDITSVFLVNEEEARGEIMKYQLEELNSRHSLDSVESFRAQRRLGKFTAYFTAPITFSGEVYPVVNRVGTNPDEQYVLLSSKSGTRLLLSPKDPVGFVDTVKNYINNSNTITEVT